MLIVFSSKGRGIPIEAGSHAVLTMRILAAQVVTHFPDVTVQPGADPLARLLEANWRDRNMITRWYRPSLEKSGWR
jgi:hypothetical protein